MESQLSYLLLTPGGQEAGSGKAKAVIDFEKETLNIKPSFGELLTIPLDEILGVSGEDYKINLTLASGEKLVLSELGYSYDDFLRVLAKLRADTAQKEMLMKEGEKKAPVEAFFIYYDNSGEIRKKGDCTLTLYDTGLVVTLDGEPIRFPYSEIAKISDEDFVLVIETEDSEKLRFSKMGRQFHPTKTALSDALNNIALETQDLLREMIPAADQLAIRKIAALMRDGKAARKSDIEAISPKAWKNLEDKLASAGMKKEYEFLKSLSSQEKICIGIKRGLMGSLSGDYLWFLAPIYNIDPKKPGNAIAMEAYSLKPPEAKKESAGLGMSAGKSAPEICGGAGATVVAAQQQMMSAMKDLAKSTSSPSPDSYYPDLKELTQDAADVEEPLDKGGKATYFFRILGPDEYSKSKNQEELDKQVDALIRTINRCMLAINFRREPIYLDEDKLEESQYKKYMLAVRSIPALQTLRQLFVGRVIHSSPKQWEKDVKGLLDFNVKSQDASQWIKT